MAEVHSRKAVEANAAAAGIEEAKAMGKKMMDAAKKNVDEAISSAIKLHSDNVVKKWN